MAQTNEYAKAESIAISMGENSIESGVVLIETDTGTITEEIVNGEQALEGRMMMAQSLDIDNMRNTDNVLKIDLRGQIAVKKVIIRITGTKFHRIRSNTGCQYCAVLHTFIQLCLTVHIILQIDKIRFSILVQIGQFHIGIWITF